MKLQKLLIVATLSFAGCRAEQAPVDASGSNEQFFGSQLTTGKVSVTNGTIAIREEFPFLLGKMSTGKTPDWKSWKFPDSTKYKFETKGRYAARLIKRNRAATIAVETLIGRCRETRKGLFHKPFREFFSSGACLTSELVRNANPCSLTSIS